ncbi:hypothetical protein SCP_0604880 [Sparassis crispa]|uniref:Uncharacterized protein n=1 Tax=Sparassis crispa TaxID=139825 RepID=A0A401GQS0_9APHY|nr:hypothetical protein SCP_0604880 [Sparassis crispa]GBE84509.1 hypothetical protein SCP_0604880 [Sparassis crispa]
MPPRTNSTPTKNCGRTAGRKSIKSDKMVADSDVEMDETSPSKQKITAVKSTPKAVVPMPRNVKAKNMMDYSDEDTVTREKAITIPHKGGKNNQTIDNSDEDMAVNSSHKAGKYQKVVESSNDDKTNLASCMSGRTAAKIASAKLKDVFMDNDSDVEQSLESDAALPINEPEITETPKKKANKAFVLLPTPISPSPNKGKATHTPTKRVYVSDSDKDAQPEQSSPIKKGRNRQSRPDSEAEASTKQSKLNPYDVMTLLRLAMTKMSEQERQDFCLQVRQYDPRDCDIRLSPTKSASGSKGKTEDVLIHQPSRSDVQKLLPSKAIVKDGKMEINNEDTDEGEENFECQVTSITLMDPILLKAGAYETLPPFRRAYYVITYQPINTLTSTGVLDGFMGYQVNKPALIKALTFAFSDGLFVNPARANIKNYQMTGSLESRLGARQLAITFGAVTFSAVAASCMIHSMSKWTKDINIVPMSLEWEWTVAFFGSFIGDNYGLYTYQNSVTMSTRPSTLEHPDYAGNSGSTSLNKMLSKASPSKAVAGRHGGPSTSADGKHAAGFILPQGKVPSTLDHWDDVVVYDCTVFFQGIESRKRDNEFSFNSVRDTCPRWNNEVPLGSFVAVLYSPSQYKTKLGTDSVSLNLMAVCILLKENKLHGAVFSNTWSLQLSDACILNIMSVLCIIVC